MMDTNCYTLLPNRDIPRISVIYDDSTELWIYNREGGVVLIVKVNGCASTSDFQWMEKTSVAPRL